MFESEIIHTGMRLNNGFITIFRLSKLGVSGRSCFDNTNTQIHEPNHRYYICTGLIDGPLESEAIEVLKATYSQDKCQPEHTQINHISLYINSFNPHIQFR